MKCTKTLTGHTDSVKALVINHRNELVSGSCDGTIKIWNLETGECVETLCEKEDDSIITSVCMITKDNRLCSAHNNNLIKIWNIDKQE